MIIEILKISLIAFMFTILGEEDRIFSPYQKLIMRLPKWLFSPLGGCFMCFTGQVCFWYYLIAYFHQYNLIDHLFFCSAGIAASFVYNKIYELVW